MSKVIAHIDMNCFYASVEEKYNPELKGKPLAIAGEVKTRHGIIVTSNYEARNLGIKTTMRVGDARKIYPNIKILRPDMSKYQQESKMIFDLVREYTDKIEIVSVDEAYIDLSDFHEPIKVIAIIQRRIYKQLGMPSSVGVSFNKFFAKMGSNLKKPLGFSIINKKNFKDILWNLDIGEMHGCGNASTKKLKKIGINTIGDIAVANEVILHSLLGVQGLRLKNKANGEGNSELKYTVDRKSIGNSKTFTNDLIDEDDILKEIKKLIQCKRYRISTGENREKNEEFIFEFDLNDEKICELLMQIEYSDFCECLHPYDISRNHEDYYLFAPEFTLSDLFGDDLQVVVYVKLIIKDDNKHQPFLVVVSFHRPDESKVLNYQFK